LFANICPSTTARAWLISQHRADKSIVVFSPSVPLRGLQRFKMYVGKYRFHGEGNRSGEEPEVQP